MIHHIGGTRDEFGTAVIARPNVTAVMTAVRIAEYRPTRFAAIVDDSVASSRVSTLVTSLAPQFRGQPLPML